MCRERTLTSGEACAGPVSVFLRHVVIAWVRADYLQFRREEVRRQRPTGIARGEEHGGCRESGAAFSMVAQVRGLLKGGLVEGLLPRGVSMFGASGLRDSPSPG